MPTMRATGPDKAAFEALVSDIGRRHSLDLIAPASASRWNDPADGLISYGCKIAPPDGWSATLHRRKLESELSAGPIRVKIGFDAEGQPTNEMAAAVDRMAVAIGRLRRRERAIETAGHDVLSPPAWSVICDALIVSMMRLANIDVDKLMARSTAQGGLRRIMTDRTDDTKVRLDLHIHRGELVGTASIHQRLTGNGFTETLRMKTGPRVTLGISGHQAPATVLSSLAGNPLGSVLATPAIAGSEDRMIVAAGQDEDSLLTLALAPRLTWLADAPPGVERDWRA